MCLNRAGERQHERHERHAARHQPEAGHVQHLIVGIAIAQNWEHVGDDREVQRNIGAEEREVAMRCRDLRAVRVEVDAVERMHEAPHAGTEERQRGGAKGPQQRGLVGMIAAAFPDHHEREHHHQEERDDLKRREDRSDPLPIARRADPIVVVAGAEDAADQRCADDHVEPFLDDFPIDARQFQHQKREDRRHHQFPYALDPQMHDVPPVHLVEAEIGSDCRSANRKKIAMPHSPISSTLVIAVFRPARTVIEIL